MTRLRLSLAALTLAATGLSPIAHAQNDARTPPPSIEVEGEGAQLHGTEPTRPSGPAPRDASGHPDLTGYWKPLKEKGKPGGNIGKDLPGFKLPLTPAGEAALQHNLTKTIDPEALCILGGIPRHDASGLPFEILQTAHRIAFLYLYSTHRFIPVDGRKHDTDPEPRFFGNPIGEWQGDTLVVDSIGFKGDKVWIDENGNPVSDAVHTVEKWTRPDADHVHLELVIDDPKYYTHPFTFSRTWVQGKPGEGLTEFACSENNVDASHIGPGPGVIGADGNRGADLVNPLPDTPPGPEFYEQKSKGK